MKEFEVTTKIKPIDGAYCAFNGERCNHLDARHEQCGWLREQLQLGVGQHYRRRPACLDAEAAAVKAAAEQTEALIAGGTCRTKPKPISGPRVADHTHTNFDAQERGIALMEEILSASATPPGWVPCEEGDTCGVCGYIVKWKDCSHSCRRRAWDVGGYEIGTTTIDNPACPDGLKRAATQEDEG